MVEDNQENANSAPCVEQPISTAGLDGYFGFCTFADQVNFLRLFSN